MQSSPVETGAGRLAAAPEPLFIELGAAPRPRRFALHHRPRGLPCGLVVQAHAFGEEMNKSRRMAAIQSRALADAGWAVLQFDLLGCGDSDGDFGDASWECWVDDLVGAAHWLIEQHAIAPGAVALPLWLWGHRAGALLAVEAARRLARPVNFLLWQPVVSGKSVLQQQLRTKAAGDLFNGQAKAAVEAARHELAQGRAIEVAGYTLQAALCAGLEAAQLAPPMSMSNDAPRVVWMEVASSDGATLSPIGERTAAQWRDAGWTVQTEVVTGPAFWQTVEVEEVPRLVQVSLQALDAHRGTASATRVTTDAVWPPARTQMVSAGTETALRFDCGQDVLIGVLHPAAPSAPPGDTGVVIVVGGPQYRAGSHRQFVELARALADAGVTVLRFDVRGMGDSSGQPRSFESLSDDIGAAVDALQRRAQVDRVILWGLCDGASAALLYLHHQDDPRVRGVGLANPWVRSQASQARTQVKHYYSRRLREPAFWRKLLRGAVSPRAVGELFAALRRARAPSGAAATGLVPSGSFQDRMLNGLLRRNAALLLLSGDDYTAREFVEYAARDPRWSAALQRSGTVQHDLAGADHTFSSRQASALAARLTAQWVAATATVCARPAREPVRHA